MSHNVTKCLTFRALAAIDLSRALVKLILLVLTRRPAANRADAVVRGWIGHTAAKLSFCAAN
jgi:hypothetical protein